MLTYIHTENEKRARNQGRQTERAAGGEEA